MVVEMSMLTRSLVLLLLGLVTVPAHAIDAKDALSVSSTVHDTAADILKGVKKLKPSDFSTALGNNAARKAQANLINSKVASALAISEKYHIPVLSNALEFSGSGAELLGATYEGDVSGAGAVILNAGISKVTVAGSAYVGGKLFASVGAAVGSSVPVVGTAAGAIVGGVVGSVGGAVLASMGADSEAVKNWVDNTVNGVFAKDKDYYTRLAKQNRDDFLADKAQEAAIAKGELAKVKAASEYGYDVPAGSSDNSEVQFSAKLPDIVLADQTKSDPGKGVPLFPSNTVIEVTSWVDPQYSGQETFIIEEGQVRAYFNGPVPTGGSAASGRREGRFDGRIEGNVITGSWSDRFQYDGLVSLCKGSIFNDSRIDIELTLNIDGSVNGQILGGTQKVRVTGCPGGDVQRTDPTPANKLQGRWKFRD